MGVEIDAGQQGPRYDQADRVGRREAHVEGTPTVRQRDRSASIGDRSALDLPGVPSGAPDLKQHVVGRGVDPLAVPGDMLGGEDRPVGDDVAEEVGIAVSSDFPDVIAALAARASRQPGS